jgi:UDP-glucose 4-epimerase
LDEKKRVLVTGGSGFLGGVLLNRIASLGWEITSVDLKNPISMIKHVMYLELDLTDHYNFSQLNQNGYELIFHLATALDFDKANSRGLFENNILGTKNILRFAKVTKSKRIIFTSSNSVYMGNKLNRPITENDNPQPIDDYGRSKVVSEEILLSSQKEIPITIIRCPNIMDAGRVGMLSILFDFVKEGKKTWILGSGKVRHQCVYAQDVIDAMLLSNNREGTQIYNIGSDDVSSIKEMYEYIVTRSNSGARTAHVPLYPTIIVLRALNKLRLIPLGPYQFRMLTKNFEFDTSKIKKELGWSPTLNNQEMLWRSFQFYDLNFASIESGNSSPNQSRVASKLISILRYFS